MSYRFYNVPIINRPPSPTYEPNKTELKQWVLRYKNKIPENVLRFHAGNQWSNVKTILKSQKEWSKKIGVRKRIQKHKRRRIKLPKNITLSQLLRGTTVNSLNHLFNSLKI